MIPELNYRLEKHNAHLFEKTKCLDVVSDGEVLVSTNAKNSEDRKHPNKAILCLDSSFERERLAN